MKVAQSCPTLCYPMDCIVHGILQARILEQVAIPFSRGSSQPRDWTLQVDSFYQLSHKGSPRILEWEAYPFPSRSSRPRNWTKASCIAGGFFISWATREAHTETQSYKKRVKNDWTHTVTRAGAGGPLTQYDWCTHKKMRRDRVSDNAMWWQQQRLTSINTVSTTQVLITPRIASKTRS